MKYAFKRGYLVKDASGLLITPKSEKRIPKYIAQQEINTALNDFEVKYTANAENIVEEAEFIRNQLILEILYSTGIRLSELVNIDTSDVSLEQKQLKVTGKGNKQRIIPFGEAVIESLRKYLSIRHVLQNNKSDKESVTALLLTKSGKRVYPRMIQRLVKSFLTEQTEAKKRVHMPLDTVMRLIYSMLEPISGSLKSFWATVHLELHKFMLQPVLKL